MSAETFSEVLKIERLFNAPVERIFKAWTEPSFISSWFGPKDFTVKKTEVDCRPGGQYEISLIAPDGSAVIHFGEYLLVDKPHKLIFTWILANQACAGSSSHQANTLVELNFFQQGAQTLLILQHEKLPDEASLRGHQFGWQSSFDNLDTILAI